MSSEDMVRQFQEQSVELSKWKTRATEAEKKLRKLTSEAKGVIRLTEEVQYLQSELDKATADRAGLAEQNKTLQAENQQGVKKLRTEIDTRKKELKTAQASIAELEHKLVVANAEIAALVQSAEMARAEVRDLKEALRELIAR